MIFTEKSRREETKEEKEILTDTRRDQVIIIVSLQTIIIMFTFMHLADAFIQSDLQLHSGYTFLISILYVFPGDQTHNLSCC